MIRPKQRKDYEAKRKAITPFLNKSEQADLNGVWRPQMTPAQWGVFEFYCNIAKQRGA